MTQFQPHLNMVLTIGAVRYAFVPHPLYADMLDEVYAIEGSEAIIYKLVDQAEKRFIGLKCFKGQRDHRALLHSTEALRQVASVPGLALGQRLCLTRAAFPALIRDYPALEYGVLLPWIEGRSWSGIIQDRATSMAYTPEMALSLAIATAQVLWELEARHMTHTDIAGTNIIISADQHQIELLDLENMVFPQQRQHNTKPGRQSHGSPGYQHRSLTSEGQHHPAGDRFAGAIVLTEMLAWANPHVRAALPPYAETLFRPEELQDPASTMYALVCQTLDRLCPAATPLLRQAWESRRLEDCPEISAWALCLIAQMS